MQGENLKWWKFQKTNCSAHPSFILSLSRGLPMGRTLRRQHAVSNERLLPVKWPCHKFRLVRVPSLKEQCPRAFPSYGLASARAYIWAYFICYFVSLLISSTAKTFDCLYNSRGPWRRKQRRPEKPARRSLPQKASKGPRGLYPTHLFTIITTHSDTRRKLKVKRNLTPINTGY